MDATGKTLKAVSSSLGGTAASAASSQSLLSSHSSSNVLTVDDVAAGNNSATDSPVTLASLQEAIKAQREWAKHIVFDGDGNILISNTKPLDGEVTYVDTAVEKPCCFYP